MKKHMKSAPNKIVEQVESLTVHEDLAVLEHSDCVQEETECKSDVKISDHVIASIVNITVKEEPGIHTLQDSLPNMIIKNKNTQGVKIVRLGAKKEYRGPEDEIDIYVNIIIDFDTKIMDACVKIQDVVKNAVENLSGINVRHVNVNVVGVFSPKASNVSKL